MSVVVFQRPIPDVSFTIISLEKNIVVLLGACSEVEVPGSTMKTDFVKQHFVL